MGENFTKREKILIGVIVMAIILIVGFKTGLKDLLASKDKPLELYDNYENDSQEPEKDEEVESKHIMVHISGQVHKPGIIELEVGQRLIDAVKLAGGMKESADLDRINLAKKLSDEDKIYIPSVDEEGEDEFAFINIGSENTTGKININNCDRSQLLSLPGVGEVIAGRIIDYREKTPFKVVEDLKKVSGIGDKKFEDIKDLIIIK